MLARDGKIEPVLTVAVPNIEISDGELNIRFDASASLPVLGALVVRNKNRPQRSWQLVWRDEFDNGGEPNPDKSTSSWMTRTISLM